MKHQHKVFFFGNPSWFHYCFASGAVALLQCSSVYVRSLCVSSKFCKDLILDGMFVCVQGGLHRFLMHPPPFSFYFSKKRNSKMNILRMLLSPKDLWVLHISIKTAAKKAEMFLLASKRFWNAAVLNKYLQYLLLMALISAKLVLYKLWKSSAGWFYPLGMNGCN